MTKLIDVSKDLELINKASLDLGTSLKDIRNNTATAFKGFKELTTTLKSTDDISSKLTKSIGALGKVGSGAALGFLELAEAGAKIGSLVTIANAAYGSFKQLSGISRTLTFETAILGTSNLSKNFEYLEATSNAALDSIKLGFKAVFDSANFTKFSGDAVAAFAPVEQAAYRLSTVTVSSGERSIDALDKNIASMRKLQKATNDALGSVELLNAQYDIASAGFTGSKDNLNVGKAAINLSQAGFGDLAGSTNATVRVLRALGDESDKADLRASQLFETTRVGLVTLDQLTPIIGSLSVQSKQLGVDFSEVTAAVAGLTTQGASAGEAGTRLEALFAEIVNAAPAANKILSEFRDEAGKPIQLNASALKTKGLRGIVKDIQTATGGDVAKISELFSTKEATEAVQLLISLGDKAFKEYTDRIKNVDTADLGKEAEGRTKTITGAFTQAQNSSQRQVEEFGSGFGDSVVEDVLASNQAFKGFATGAAEAIGKVTGTVSGLLEKVKGIGSFLATAFTTVAPFAIFAAISTKVKQLGASLKKEAKEGESIWDVLKRKAIDAFADIYKRFSTTMDMVKAKAKATGKEIQDALNGENRPGEQLGLFDSLPNVDKSLKSTEKDKLDRTTTPYNTKQDTSSLKSNRKSLSSLRNSKQLEFDFPATKAKGLAGLKQSLTILQAKGVATFTSLKGAATTGFAAIGKAGAFAAPFLKSMIAYLGSMLITLGAFAAALAIASGWISTFSSLLDKRNNPALQEMAENLKEIKNVEGLGDVLKEFDKNASAIESTNFNLNVMNEMLARSKGLWNQISGASTRFSTQTAPEIERVSKLLDEQIAKNSKLASQGKVGTDTIEGKRAEDKISKGITLSGDDETALKKETEDKQKVLDARVQQQELLLKQKKESDKFDEEGVAKEEEKLRVLKQQAEQEKKLLQTALDKKLLEQQITRFKNIDTTIPISVQLQEQSTNSIKAQIKEVKDILNTPNEDIFGDPAKYSAQFAEITKRLGSTIDAIQVEVDLDVNNADELRNQLIKEVGEENFNKLVASNPQFRQKFSDLNKSISTGKTQQAKLTETGSTAVFDAAQALGSESTALSAAKFAAQTKSINSQVSTLNAELQRPETSLNRQREIIAEIEQLEAQRAKLSIEAKISKELGTRKQQLTLDQQILDIKKATLNLFNQESKFASLSITASQAKVQAAQQELAVKKEQISIANKEELIKKQGIVDALKARETRGKEQANAGLGSNFKTDDPNIKQKLKDNAESFKQKTLQETQNKLEVNKADKERRLQEVQDKAKKFSDEEQKKISEALRFDFNGRGDKARESLFNKDGTLKEDEAKIKERLAKTAQSASFNTAGDARAAQDIFTDKRLKTAQEKKSIEKEAASTVKTLEETSKAEIEKRSNLVDAVQKRLENGLGNTANVSGKPNDNASEEKSEDSSAQQGTTAQDDLNFTKAISALREKLGTLAERISLNEAKIEAEFASREKLIRRGELLGESLRNLASKSSLFADTFAGAALNLNALRLENKSGRLQKEADLEIAKINQKVKDLAENAKDAVEAAQIAREAGADEKTISKLDNQAKDASKLADTAKKEQKGDIEFVKQKTSLDKLAASVELAEAEINKEFASRERLAKQANELADGFARLAGNSLLSGTVAGASLNLAQAQTRKNSGAADTKADKEIALVNARVAAFRKLAEEKSPAGEAARRDLAKVEAEAKKDIESINSNRALQKIAEAFEVAAAEIEKEFASRQRLIEINDALSSSFSSLAGVVSGLFKNSSIGASISKFSAQINAGSNKAGLEYNKQNALLERRSVELAKAVSQAKKDGASSETIKELVKARDENEKQKPIEKAYLEQKLVLDTLTEKFSLMSAEVEEVSDRLAKQAESIKQSIEFQDRQRAATLENNKSGTGLQSALVSFLGKNNPVSQQLLQRLEVQQARDDAKGQQAENVSAAKKEIIDTTLQKSQLDLEQKSYENAITQTALLSDLVSVTQGGEATASQTDLVKKQIEALPSLFKEGQAQAKKRSSLLDERLAFIPKELEGKQANVKRNLLAGELNILGGNLNAANIDLLTRTLNESESELKQFKRQDFQVGSLQDKQFQEQLKTIGSTKIPSPTRKDLIIDNSVKLQPTANNANQAGQTVQIQAPVSIKIEAPSGGGVDMAKWERLMMERTGQQVNAAMDKLSRQIGGYAQKF